MGAAVGCKAQPPQQPSPDQTLNRRIEVIVRSKLNAPEEIKHQINIAIGARKPSLFAGYQTLPVTLSTGVSAQMIDFLISTDNTTLAHLTTIGHDKDSVFLIDDSGHPLPVALEGKKLAKLEKFDLANNPIFSIDIAGRPIRGNPAAKVTVINFDDLECPFCAQMHQALFPETLARYKDTVRFVYKDNPLPAEMHPWAMRAAVDANCMAALSGPVYWSFVDYLHSHSDEITGPTLDLARSNAALDRIARQQATLGKLDAVQVDACLAKQDESQVRASMNELNSLKLEGAPLVFVNGELIVGALPQALVWQVIDRALRAAGVEPPPDPAKAAPTPHTTPAPAQQAPPAM